MNRVARISVALVWIAAASTAAAQWAWKDESGRVVYSDRPPPASVKSDQIVRQPGRAANDTSMDSRADTKAAPRTWADREAEYKKRQVERAESDKKGAEEQAQLAQRRADCERARSYAATLESGVRVARTDAKGERSFLDDDQRAAELARARDLVSKTCQ
jgi:hypothetical protein